MSAVASSPATGRRRVYRNRLQRMLNSSIGLKITIALTGVILSGFVLVHMLGNLQVYQGAEASTPTASCCGKSPRYSGPSVSSCSRRSDCISGRLSS